MKVGEILNAAQVSTFEERKRLIKRLLVQMLCSGILAAIIATVNDSEAANRNCGG